MLAKSTSSSTSLTSTPSSQSASTTTTTQSGIPSSKESGSSTTPSTPTTSSVSFTTAKAVNSSEHRTSKKDGYKYDLIDTLNPKIRTVADLKALNNGPFKPATSFVPNGPVSLSRNKTDIVLEAAELVNNHYLSKTKNDSVMDEKTNHESSGSILNGNVSKTESMSVKVVNSIQRITSSSASSSTPVTYASAKTTATSSTVMMSSGSVVVPSTAKVVSTTQAGNLKFTTITMPTKMTVGMTQGSPGLAGRVVTIPASSSKAVCS